MNEPDLDQVTRAMAAAELIKNQVVAEKSKATRRMTLEERRSRLDFARPLQIAPTSANGRASARQLPSLSAKL